MKRTLYYLIGMICLSSLLSCGNKKSEGSVDRSKALAAQNEIYEQADAAQNGNFEVTLISDETLEDGSRHIAVRPSGVCSRQIDIAVKDGVIVSVEYTGGCPGNTQGVSRLVAGLKVEDAISKLEGIDCGGKGTSCPDQLSKALKLFLNK